MKNKMSVFVLFIFMLVFTSNLFSQGFPYNEYKTRTLAEFSKIHSGIKGDGFGTNKAFMISAKPFYSSVRIKYTGKSRVISKARMDVMKLWQGSLGIKASVLTLLDKEYLFEECGKGYWIPVQKQVAAYFAKELKTDDQITLYLMAVGGVRPVNQWEYLFLVNEFKTYK